MTASIRPSADHPSRAEPRPDIGLTAFGLAVALVLMLIIGMQLARHPALEGTGAAIATTLWLAQSCGMILAFLLGVAAVRTGRGRRWGIAAMVLGVLGNAYVWLAVFRLLTPAGS